MTRPEATPYDLAGLRREIPLLATTVPMNHCSQAPQTTATRAAAMRYLDSWNRAGMDWDAWIGEVEAARASFARLIGAAPDEVAVFSSVSHATAAVASCMDVLSARTGRRTIALTEAAPSEQPILHRPSFARTLAKDTGRARTTSSIRIVKRVGCPADRTVDTARRPDIH